MTGTSSFGIPLPIAPARGFEPQLNLGCDSGAGNGPFGLGWTLTVPSIGRKTEKGLPTYADGDDGDIYVTAGAEDLVPLLEEKDGHWQPAIARRELSGEQWEVKFYRPRIEGAFARIERWRHPTTGIHDFHRSAVRNNSRSGMIEKVSMHITGHKTRSFYDCYNIVSENDIKTAMEGK